MEGSFMQPHAQQVMGSGTKMGRENEMTWN
jgi:hypothetical protein